MGCGHHQKRRQSNRRYIDVVRSWHRSGAGLPFSLSSSGGIGKGGVVNLEVKIIGDEELKRAFREVPEVIRKELGEAVMRAGYFLESKAKAEAPVNTGQLRGSITTQGAFFSGEDVTAKVGTNVKYAPFMEYGTRPHTPPISALKVWARQKFGDERIAFAVQKAISRRGTQGRKYFTNPFENVVKPKVREYIQEALVNITHFLSK